MSWSDTQTNARVIKHIPGRLVTAAGHGKEGYISPRDKGEVKLYRCSNQHLGGLEMNTYNFKAINVDRKASVKTPNDKLIEDPTES